MGRREDAGHLVSTRPSVAPAVLADLVAAVPARVSKRLDAKPRAADEWTWSYSDVVTVAAGEETVTLAVNGIFEAKDATCTCLLQPRCFHLLAVLTVLNVASTHPEGEVAPREVDPRAAPVSPAAGPASPTHAERGIADDAWRLGARILGDGLSRVSTLRMGELLRLVHAARREGLPRLESAALGVYESVRDLRDKSPSFRLDDAAARLAELLLVAYRVASGDGGLTWRGIGRRTYHAVATGGLRLAGIASEPVLQRGYAGVVTYFTDGERVYSAHEVLPGDTDRARDAYEAQLRFGETSLTHAEASRGGLLFARAEVSADGRLGAGREVTCVATARDAALLDAHFAEPFESQLALADRGERMGLLFLRGAFGGESADAAFFSSGALSLPLATPIDDVRFAYRENLARLVERGTRCKLLARVTADGTKLSPLAIWLTTGSGEKLFALGYDRLGKHDLDHESALLEGATAILTTPAPAPAVRADVLDAVKRRLLRYALAGEPSLPGAALPDVADEAKRLRRALFPKAADGLEALALCDDPERAARVWLALHVYTRVVEKTFARAAWGDAGA